MRPDGIRKGPPPAPARDGDKAQARHRVRHYTAKGWLPHPSSLPCADCGRPAREYDHYLGYGAEHHLDVQPVCRLCHMRRGIDRGEINNRAGTGRPRSVPACTNCGRVNQKGERYTNGRCKRCDNHWRYYGLDWPTKEAGAPKRTLTP